jgi:hypothetical protein
MKREKLTPPAQMWCGIEVGSARDVCALLNEASTCDACAAGACHSRWHAVVNNDGTDAPVWGEIPTDVAIVRDVHIRGLGTIWSWDAAGAVVGGDGTYNDDEPFRFVDWDDVRTVQKD